MSTYADTPPDGVDIEKLAAEARAKALEQANKTADALERAHKSGRRLPTGKHRLPKSSK